MFFFSTEGLKRELEIAASSRQGETGKLEQQLEEMNAKAKTMHQEQRKLEAELEEARRKNSSVMGKSLSG